MGAAVQLQSAVERFVSAPVRKMLIDGKWVEAARGRRSDHQSRHGQVLARSRRATRRTSTAPRAPRAARSTTAVGAAQSGRAPAPAPQDRRLIDANGDELAQLETLDNASLHRSRHVDIPAAAETFRYYAGWVTKIYGETNPSDAAFFNFTLREPVGVCGQIIPWTSRSSCARGSSRRRSPAQHLRAQARRADPAHGAPPGRAAARGGVPAGVVNIVPGFGPTAGGALVRHPMVDKIAFTGSTEVGRRSTARPHRRSSACRSSWAASRPTSSSATRHGRRRAGALLGVFFCAGQVCCAGTRLFVEQKTHDEFADKLAKTAAG